MVVIGERGDGRRRGRERGVCHCLGTIADRLPLDQYRGNITAAARASGKSRQGLKKLYDIPFNKRRQEEGNDPPWSPVLPAERVDKGFTT